MAQQDRDVESRKTVNRGNSDVLEEVSRRIHSALERAAAAGVDLHDFELRTRRKIKSKKGKVKRGEYGSHWATAPYLIDSFYLPEMTPPSGGRR
jgi:hypothetical protein